MVDDDELIYRSEVKDVIERKIKSGITSIKEIIVAIGSPDPRLVQELYDEIMKGKGSMEKDPAPERIDIEQRLYARRLSAQLPLLLPAADSMRSQWWFTLDTVVKLAEVIEDLVSSGESTAFLGCPTVGFHYATWLNRYTTILDVDKDIINSLVLPSNTTKISYDVRNPLPETLLRKHKLTLIDPPWYPAIMDLFLLRALELGKIGSYILCILPSRLTRRHIIQERTDLLCKLLQTKFEVVSLETNFVSYRVPQFEVNAYGDLDGFSGRQWRKGDLLILKIGSETTYNISYEHETSEPLAFSKNPSVMRFFLATSRIDPSITGWVSAVETFETSVRKREVNVDKISVWGTNKKAATLKETNIAKKILESWSEGKSKEKIISELINEGFHESANYVAELDKSINLWYEDSAPHQRRTPDQLEEITSKVLSEFASSPTKRIYPYEEDGFRLDFQRDRDRILWSHALKRLANKTQLFPVSSDNHLRRRLTHSIEVMQLASTIAVSFGLNRDLTEAGALAHDIGHTPFGHAGEYSLNDVLNVIDPRLGGFNHYEHGVDTARWIENVYLSPGVGGFPGLNLTKETVECIIKHTFDREGKELSQSSLLRVTKHKDLDDSSCHLEGQAVRIADKISYLISDLEDGIRIGAIHSSDLSSCRLFERPPIDLNVNPRESLYDRFLSQRRSILKVLMEDILKASDERLALIKNANEIRSTREYLIDYSPSIKEDVYEIWNKLQREKLHNYPTVVEEQIRAARIICDLFLVYTIAPKLISATFRDSYYQLRNSEYIKWYESKVGKQIGISKSLLLKFSYRHILGSEPRAQGENYIFDTFNLIMAKDFVANLTDTTAIEEHKKNCTETI